MLDERISEWLLELYRGSREVPAEAFQGWAMERLHVVLGFDSGFWAAGIVQNARLRSHSHFLDNQPPEMMENYAKQIALHGDRLAAAVTAKPWVTIDMRDCYSDWYAAPIYRDHARLYGMEHIISTASEVQPTGLQVGISCYRADARKPFTDDERRLKEHLFRHVVEAATINQFLFLETASDPEKGGLAVCDRFGVIHRCSRLFREVLMAEFAEWDGVRLPHRLVGRLVAERARVAHVCEHISIEALPFADLFLLRARYRTGTETLTPRQRQIAERLARGMGYKEIAAELKLSPHTITNHANAIYAKLGLRNKAELARLLAAHGRG